MYEDRDEKNTETRPVIKCPGCGVEVAWLSNCGRYACIDEYGAPILLDSIHRREIEKQAASETS